MVLLKVLLPLYIQHQHPNLHSNMVLLKEDNAIQKTKDLFTFTFQYGSIKGHEWKQDASWSCNPFTFQYGSIKGHY